MTGTRLHPIRLPGAGPTALPSAAASAEMGGVRPAAGARIDSGAIRITRRSAVIAMGTAGGGQLPAQNRLGSGSLDMHDEQKISAQAGGIGQGP